MRVQATKSKNKRITIFFITFFLEKLKEIKKLKKIKTIDTLSLQIFLEKGEYFC